jgi:hypothetical protein
MILVEMAVLVEAMDSMVLVVEVRVLVEMVVMMDVMDVVVWSVLLEMVVLTEVKVMDVVLRGRGVAIGFGG